MANSSFFGTSGTTATVTNTIQTSVDAAATSATNAETAKTAAETAKSASETAQAASEAARNSAQGFRDTAETHKDDAETAKTAAETAQAASENARDAASTSATNSATSESNAATSATNSANSAASAASASTSAASSLASFQGQYSTGSSDPTTNLDTGDLFFNSTSDAFKVYNGSAWQLTIPSPSNQTNIDTVAGQISPTNNISTLAGISSDITGVNSISSAVTAVNSNATNINAVNSNSTNINAVNSNSTNINTVAGQISPTNNLSTVAGLDTEIGNLGPISANITTVANNITGVNSFADRYRVGSSDPSSSNDEGDLFYNTTSNALKVYTGSAWEQGVTAGSGFLPLSGGQLTGNLTFSGSETVDGRDVSADGSKLDGIEANATADQTAPEIKTAYESNSNTNAFTDALQTKLNGIEASADVTDTTNVVAALTAGTDISIAANGTIAYTGSSEVVGDTTPQLGGDLDTNGNDINFGDNAKAIFGAGNDLQLYHDGINSYVQDAGTGDLRISGNNVNIMNGAATENYIVCTNNGSVAVKHDNATKLETTSSGIDVTGTVTADGLDVQGDGTISGGSRLTISDIADVNNDGIRLDDNTTSRFNNLTQDSSGNFKIQHYTGSAWQNNLTVTTGGDLDVAGNATFDDNGKAIFGAGSDLQIYHDGSSSYVKDNGSGNLVIDTNGAGTYLMHGSEIMASFVADGAVGLRHDNSEKLATTSTGIDVTGDVLTDTMTLDNGSNDWQFSVDGSNNLIISYGGTSKAKLDSSGNLTVVGNVTAFGSI